MPKKLLFTGAVPHNCKSCGAPGLTGKRKYCEECRKAKRRALMQDYFRRPEVKERQKERTKAYREKPEVKKRVKEYYHQEGVKERLKEYRKRPEVRERIREYYRRPEVKEKMREYLRRPEVKARSRELYRIRKEKREGPAGGAEGEKRGKLVILEMYLIQGTYP
jgi:hypothetical protein